MTTTQLNFAQRAEISKENPALRMAMEKAEVGLFRNADIAMSHPDYQTWRSEIAQIKQEGLRNLDTLLEEFEQNAIVNGTKVHWAKDETDACHIINNIAKEHNCKTLIKSKTMLAEEINLNKFLEKSDMHVLETDLGEYIIQLKDERPSHIIAPAIHLTAEDVNKLFIAKHKTKYKDKHEDIVAEARKVLRPQFLTADMGLTGANYLIANTGSVVVVTNEGNDRFCSTIPKVKVTIAGIEKVIPSFAKLANFLRVLPRAATGQHSSTYVSISTGANEDTNPLHDHVVLIDNGRSKMLSSKYRAMLRCIRCGSCMNHCPVYKVAGGLSYNSVYVGPMGAVLSPNLFGEEHNELPHAATMCGACSANCPVKIPLPNLMRNLREDQIDNNSESFISKLFFTLWGYAVLNPKLYRCGVKLMSIFIRIFAKNGVISKLPFSGAWFNHRNFTYI